MKLFILLLFLLSSVSSYAKLKINDFKGAKIYLNTAPGWCEPCKYLEESLQASGEPDKIKVRVDGVELNFEIVKLDHSNNDSEVTQKAIKLGFNDGVPKFKIFSANGEDLSQKEVMPCNVTLSEVSETDTVEEYILNVQKSNFTKKAFIYNLQSHIYELLGIEPTFSTNDQYSDFSPFAYKTNILIAGSAFSPLDNPAFTGLSIKSISETLDGTFAQFPTILYGSGKSKSRDTVISENDKQQFVKIAGVNAQATFTRENLASFFNATNTAEAKNNLLIFVGHGSNEGSLMWGQDPLSPSELSSLNKESKSQNVLVSGNCFGGVMAKSVSCGFMGANPHVTASGCWEDVETGKDIQDYTKVYFRALEDYKADINGDGLISFSEAHIYAIIHGEKVDIPYSSTDALVEDYFIRTKEPLSETPTLNEIRVLVQTYGNEEDKHLLESLAPLYWDDSIKIINTGEPENDFVTIKHKGNEYTLKKEFGENSYIFATESNSNESISVKIILIYSNIIEISWMNNENNIVTMSFYLKEDNSYLTNIYKVDKDGNHIAEIENNLKGTSKIIDLELLSKIKDNKEVQKLMETLSYQESTDLLDHGNLYQLYKRMMYKANIEFNEDENEKLTKIRACETQNISEFLNP